MTGDETVTDGAVWIGDRAVDWVGPAAALPAEHAALPRADYPGATIMPGLIDSHVHLGFDGGANPVARMRGETGERKPRVAGRARCVRGGPGPRPGDGVAGSPITVTGGHCWFMGGEADSDDDLRRMVRTHHKHGADLIKVMATGGFMTSGSAPWYAQFTAAQLAAT